MLYGNIRLNTETGVKKKINDEWDRCETMRIEEKDYVGGRVALEREFEKECNTEMRVPLLHIEYLPSIYVICNLYLSLFKNIANRIPY